MSAVRLTCQWWDQPTDGGYVRRVKGETVEVSESEAERLIRARAAEPVQVSKPRTRRKAADTE